jgi:hypothetical protein
VPDRLAVMVGVSRRRAETIGRQGVWDGSVGPRATGGGRGVCGGTLRTGPVVGDAVGATLGVCWGTLRAGAGAGGRAMVAGVFAPSHFGFRVTVVHVASGWAHGESARRDAGGMRGPW